MKLKQAKTLINIQELLHTLPESTQQVIRGGNVDQTALTETEVIDEIGTPTIAVGGYIRIKKLNSGG